ncbi:MAG: tetratricopeptide repeat protein [Chlamydiia bacterium]
MKIAGVAPQAVKAKKVQIMIDREEPITLIRLYSFIDVGDFEQALELVSQAKDLSQMCWFLFKGINRCEEKENFRLAEVLLGRLFFVTAKRKSTEYISFFENLMTIYLGQKDSEGIVRLADMLHKSGRIMPPEILEKIIDYFLKLDEPHKAEEVLGESFQENPSVVKSIFIHQIEKNCIEDAAQMHIKIEDPFIKSRLLAGGIEYLLQLDEMLLAEEMLKLVFKFLGEHELRKILLHLARRYLNRGNLAKAIEYGNLFRLYETSPRVHSEDIFSRVILSYLDIGDAEKAEEILPIFDEGQNQNDSRIKIAKIHLEKGDTERAVNVLVMGNCNLWYSMEARVVFEKIIRGYHQEKEIKKAQRALMALPDRIFKLRLEQELNL